MQDTKYYPGNHSKRKSSDGSNNKPFSFTEEFRDVNDFHSYNGSLNPLQQSNSGNSGNVRMSTNKIPELFREM